MGEKMEKRIVVYGKELNYNLQYKPVKNINLRIKPDCSICVSANRKVSVKVIEKFIQSKADFIFNVLERFENMQKNPPMYYFNEEEVKKIIMEISEEVYPYFKNTVVTFPDIIFKRMTSRWGSCNPGKNRLTFNINLQFAPYECIRYVVLHEFVHFLQFNHSNKFYKELEKVCPDWKNLRTKLKEINI